MPDSFPCHLNYIIESKMIAKEHLSKLKTLFAEDGISLSDDSALEVGLWLLERARSVAVKIPSQNLPVLKKIEGEMASFRTLHKSGRVRHADAKPCKEI